MPEGVNLSVRDRDHHRHRNEPGDWCVVRLLAVRVRQDVGEDRFASVYAVAHLVRVPQRDANDAPVGSWCVRGVVRSFLPDPLKLVPLSGNSESHLEHVACGWRGACCADRDYCAFAHDLLSYCTYRIIME